MELLKKLQVCSNYTLYCFLFLPEMLNSLIGGITIFLNLRNIKDQQKIIVEAAVLTASF